MACAPVERPLLLLLDVLRRRGYRKSFANGGLHFRDERLFFLVALPCGQLQHLLPVDPVVKLIDFLEIARLRKCCAKRFHHGRFFIMGDLHDGCECVVTGAHGHDWYADAER